MVYRPTGSARMRYPPVPSLDVVRTWLVPALVALMVAPPTTAPVGSCTVPRIEPVTSALSQSQVVKRISPARNVRHIFISPLCVARWDQNVTKGSWNQALRGRPLAFLGLGASSTADVSSTPAWA